MSYFNIDLYETKREIVKYSKDIAKDYQNQKKNLSWKSTALQEPIQLRNTVERLSDHLASFDNRSLEIIKRNYYKKVCKCISDEPLVLLDNSEIVKRYGKKFEGLCRVRDASSLNNDTFPGYRICEATVVTKKEKK